ncbi:MAG: sugar-binding domain-containing protein [Limisphaerales bacterium]
MDIISQRCLIAALCFCAAGPWTLAQQNFPPQGDSKSLRESPDAQLPAGISLDWDKINNHTANEKRASLTLDGIWRFIPATKTNSEPPDSGWAYIRVPGGWQNSGDGRRGGGNAFVAQGTGPEWNSFDGSSVSRAWYERQVTIPKEWQGRSLSLRFDRISTDAIIYVNGQECGKVEWPWGSVDITSAVKPGETATIRILVAAIADAEQVGRFWQNAFLNVSFSAARLQTRGLSGNVFLDSRASEGHVSAVYVRTSTRQGEIALDMDVADVKQAGQVQISADMVDDSGRVEKQFATRANLAAKDRQTLTVSWPWKNPRLWDIGQPNRYLLRLKLKGREVDDQIEQKFGFREFWVEGRQLYLNGTVVHLRQGCFANGPKPQAGETLWEMGSEHVDARGDTADATDSLEEADRKGYLSAVYILDANKYMISSRGVSPWEQSKPRALERAAEWIHHYYNHPSAVIWVAGFNLFNDAVDADPRHIGRDDWGRGQEARWDRLIASGKEMFEGLKKIDPTRVYYSHAGAYAGDIYTMNLYLDFLPIQEREDWLSAWAERGQMPIDMVEFGTPMDCSFRRGRHGFASNITSEPLLTEMAAIYFGNDAYSGEESAYRVFLHDLFRGGMLYGSSENKLDIYSNDHRIQQLYRVNTWRAWRAAGLPGGLRTWSWMQDALQEVNSPTLAYIGGPTGNYTAKDHHFASGQRIQKQIVLINDTRQPQTFAAEWTVSVGGKQVEQGGQNGTLGISEIRFIPFEASAPPVETGGKIDGRIALKATIGTDKSQDSFGFRVFGQELASSGDIAVIDPDGLTSKMVAALGYSIRPWDGRAAPLVVVGRNALKNDPSVAAKLEAFVRGGGRALIAAQDPDWMGKALGWRVCPKVARRVFPLNFPVNFGMDADDLRDWNGNSTLIEAFPEYVGDYLRGNEREQPYAGWHWGNRGGVSSAPVEKPHRSGWRPLLECEWDLAYSPLMELDCGAGRVVLCTLDLEDHYALDPAAARTAGQIMDYALHGPLSPRARKVIYLGGDAGGEWLDKIGVTYERALALDTSAALVLVGPDARVDDAALNGYLKQGGRAFFLPHAGKNPCFGVSLQPAQEHFAGSLAVPDWPETRGLSASDLRWRTYMDSPSLLVSAGADIGAKGLVGRKTVGKGVAVFCQIDPDALRADEETYFRYTRWRETRAVAQLLANLGASFAVDARLFHPLDPWALNLNGEWKMKVTLKFSVTNSSGETHADPGMTAAALASVTTAQEKSGEWIAVNLPQIIPVFKDHNGEAVFRKEVTIPDSEAGKDLLLELGAIGDFDTAYFNQGVGL